MTTTSDAPQRRRWTGMAKGTRSSAEKAETFIDSILEMNRVTDLELP